MLVNNPDHGDRIAEAAGCIYNPRGDVVISRVDAHGELLGGVLLTGYNRNGSIALHMAGFAPNWADRKLISAVFSYCFDNLNLKKVFALVPSDNAKALEIDRRLGFKDEVVVPDVFADADLVVMSMRRDECRWLRRNTRRDEVSDGREGRGAPAAGLRAAR